MNALTPNSPVIDVSLWLGQYPFRGIPNSALPDLRAKMQALNIERGIVAAFENVFWENGLEAYQRLAEELAGDEVLDVWPVVRPGATLGLEKLLDRYAPRGLRLLPNYHEYRLADPAIADLMQLARDRKMIVQVFARIADERWHYMLKTPAVDTTDLEYFTSCFAGQPLLLCGMNGFGSIGKRLTHSPLLTVDLSRIRGPLFAIEELVKALPSRQIVFGSLWPIQIIEATLWQVTTAKIDDDARRSLLCDNARRLLGVRG